MWYAFVKKKGVAKGAGAYDHLDLCTVLINAEHAPGVWDPTMMNDPENPQNKHTEFVWVVGNNITGAQLNALLGRDQLNPQAKTLMVLDTSFMTAKQLADADDRTKATIFATSKGASTNFTTAKVAK